jgi:myo-inositol-1(or 4)-monophosphatase
MTGAVDWSPQRWHDVCAEAADAACAALRALDPDTWADHVGIGADGTLTVEADRAAEAALLDVLATHAPDAVICSEEAGVSGDGDVVLIVDPVDGTNNAVRGIPYWGLGIAVVVAGEPRHGFVRNVPARQDMFGSRGGDVGVSWSGRRARTSGCTRLSDAVLASQRPAEPDALRCVERLFVRSRMTRLLGAAVVDLAYVACGVLDGYVNVNTDPATGFGEKVVDFAAGAVLIEAAGGVVTDATGAPLPFAPDLAARVPVVAAATPALHAALLDVVAGGDR